MYPINTGRAHPLGATPDSDGVNFSVFSENATGMELLLFARHNDPLPQQVIPFHPVNNHTFSFWHVYVVGLRPGACYAYRVDGHWNPAGGYRFNKNKVLIDPYAKANVNDLWQRADACDSSDNTATSMRSVVVDIDKYNWQGDTPLHRPIKDTLIYEMHVGGFSKSQTAAVQHPGTFAAVVEKIPYLQDLGITAVELLPIFDFDESEVLGVAPDGSTLKNYWGYSTVGFYAPDSSYSRQPAAGNQINEFRDMVKALHKAGIEVILDVVFNHTNEGNHLGPVFSFKGFDNLIYYYLSAADKQYYMDYTGCGNTMNCNHPIVEKFIVDCLKFWVQEMHVDGFRFDEASILSRGENGAPMQYPPVLWQIELSEYLADTKIIAEAWDAGGLYQVGVFPGYRWAEWNGRFRDDVRRFVRGDPGFAGAVASRIAGSADMYQHSLHKSVNSINFITCHDGFTMMDLVSYCHKHNEANGEGNRDGADENYSANYGSEGASEEESLQFFRCRQIKNFAVILLVSQGVPMLLYGDEVGRTQQGNNNSYCQDNEISWFNWQDVDKNRDLHYFFRQMIAFRNSNDSLRRGDFFNGSKNERGLPDIAWHGCRLYAPGWDDPACRVLAFTLASFTAGQPDIHVLLNMAEEELVFELPKARQWYRVADTSYASPDDFLQPGREQAVSGSTYPAGPFSAVILIAH